MTIPKSKWFSFNRKTFASKAQPHTLKTAWEKTLEKWELIVKGYNPTLLRQEGWLHKDDKAKGLNCTIGEVLEQVGEMVKGYEILEEAIKHKLHLLPGMFNFDLLINNALTLKLGERIRKG